MDSNYTVISRKLLEKVRSYLDLIARHNTKKKKEALKALNFLKNIDSVDSEALHLSIYPYTTEMC